MSTTELQRAEVLALRRAGKLSQQEAARRLAITTRQMRRLEARVEEGGLAALRSHSRGRPSNRRIKAATVATVASLVREHYRDFAPTLAGEYLAERHGIALSKETVRQIMIQAKLWRPRRGPAARVYALRERRARFGELIQIDGSFHPWFEGRAPSCCLIVFIDDATSALTQLRFIERECTLGYMDTLHGHILLYGLPMAVYSDRHGIFRVNLGEHKDQHQSQFGRALASLGIEGICANSPQAKGRVERANGVLQDRLVKAMRLAGISSIAAANAWLPTFLAKHNGQFAIAPQDLADAHVAYQGPAPRLRHILAKHHSRTLSKNLSCQYDNTVLQLHPQSSALPRRGAEVTILEHFDGQTELLWRFASLPFTATARERKAPLTLDRKEVTQPKMHPKHAPAPHNHPWKTLPIGKLSPEFIRR